MIGEEIRKAIDKLNSRLSEGFVKGDTSIIASVYAEDAVILPPDTNMIRGKKAIKEFWGAAMESGVKEANLTTLELSGGGEYVHEMGTCVLKIQPKGGKPTEQNVKYVVVWRRTADGWRINWDIWNNISSSGA